MSDPIRWGILGAAEFARRHMGPAIHAAKGAKLAALATSSADKAAGFRAFAPDIHIHDSYDNLLDDDGIDALYIPLPNHMHVEWTKKALAAGKAVLTEKPIALNEGEFDDLIAARDKAGLLAAEAYMIVHHPQWQMARRLLDEGAIGKLVHVDGMFCFDNRADTNNIRNRPETAGGGLRDIGVYPFGAARFASGEEPTSVTAKVRFENDVDVFAHVMADFPSFSFNAVMSMRVYRHQRMSFYGETGVMTLTAPFNPVVASESQIQVETGGNTLTTHRFPELNQYVLQVEAFGDSIRNNTPYACPLEFSRGTQRMIDMVLSAAR